MLISIVEQFGVIRLCTGKIKASFKWSSMWYSMHLFCVCLWNLRFYYAVFTMCIICEWIELGKNVFKRWLFADRWCIMSVAGWVPVIVKPKVTGPNTIWLLCEEQCICLATHRYWWPKDSGCCSFAANCQDVEQYVRRIDLHFQPFNVCHLNGSLRPKKLKHSLPFLLKMCARY
jgi:hypothetical protein